MRDLITIAQASLNIPNGMGDSILAANSESWAPYYKFLYTVVKQYTPHVCLELGVYLGTATSHMALGCGSTTVLGVDNNYHPHARLNLSRHPNVVLFEGFTTAITVRFEIADFLERLSVAAGGPRRIGLLFLDSTHDGETPKNEFLTYQDLFADECLVVCDDLIGPKHLEIKMQEFWEWLPGEKHELHYLHPRVNDSHDEPGFGVSIVRRQNANS